MEPPKKRKYPADPGTCGLVGVVVKAEMEEGQGVYSDQHHVVSNSGGVPQPAKRNRRSYSLEFKVAVLDSYYNDPETRLNQRKTALKYGVNRRQIQKWLAQEETLRGSVGAGYTQNHSLGQIPNFTPTNTPLPPTATPTQSEHKLPLSNYLNYQSKIDYLRRLSPTPEQNQSVTVVEVTPEIGSGEEGDYVIDESDSYQPGGDYHQGTEYPDDRLDEDEQYDNKPINLSKAVNLKRDDQVDSTRNSRDMRESRDQMNEVGSSVALSTPQSTYLASSQPHLSSQPESLRKPRSHPDPVSSHILDTSVGLPAKGVSVSMYRMGGEQAWTKLQSRVTNADGRASNFLSWEQFQPGTYKMHFSTGQYFKERATETFYPYAEVIFEIKDPEAHYHIPLLLNPYGYSTYRGS